MLELVVRDDGVSMEPAYRNGRAGHWGVSGIRERSAQIGAACKLESAPGRGTVWQFQLSAALAYAPGQAAALAGHDARAVAASTLT